MDHAKLKSMSSLEDSSSQGEEKSKKKITVDVQLKEQLKMEPPSAKPGVIGKGNSSMKSLLQTTVTKNQFKKSFTPQPPVRRRRHLKWRELGRRSKRGYFLCFHKRLCRRCPVQISSER